MVKVHLVPQHVHKIDRSATKIIKGVKPILKKLFFVENFYCNVIKLVTDRILSANQYKISKYKCRFNDKDDTVAKF